MKKLQKSIRAIAAVMLMGTAFSLTSCDVMLDVLGGMSSGMAYYSPYGYTSSFGVSTNNNYQFNPSFNSGSTSGIGSVSTGGYNSTSSGTKTKDCSHCDHSGKCGNCYGKGHHLVLGTDQKCTNCNGTGICPWCGGAGKR